MPKTASDTERNARIVAHYRQSRSLAKTAAAFGLSRTRTNQIVLNARGGAKLRRGPKPEAVQHRPSTPAADRPAPAFVDMAAERREHLARQAERRAEMAPARHVPLDEYLVRGAHRADKP